MTAAPEPTPSPGEALREMDAKATDGWELGKEGVSLHDCCGPLFVLNKNCPTSTGARQVAVAVTLRNALPALAALCDAADALRYADMDSDFDVTRACRAYDADRAAFVAALKGD